MVIKRCTKHKTIKYNYKNGSSGIRTHASEETGALIQRLRPLGHATNSQLRRDSNPEPLD